MYIYLNCFKLSESVRISLLVQKINLNILVMIYQRIYIIISQKQVMNYIEFLEVKFMSRKIYNEKSFCISSSFNFFTQNTNNNI